MHAREVDVGDALEVRARALQLVALGIGEAHAQRPQATHAAVVGGRAAKRHGYLVKAPLERIANELAGAIGGGVEGIAKLVRHQGQPRSRCHLDERAVLVEHAVANLHLVHQRTVDAKALQGPAHGAHHCLGGALAAVRHRHAGALAAAKHLLSCLLQQLGRGFAAQ